MAAGTVTVGCAMLPDRTNVRPTKLYASVTRTMVGMALARLCAHGLLQPRQFRREIRFDIRHPHLDDAVITRL